MTKVHAMDASGERNNEASFPTSMKKKSRLLGKFIYYRNLSRHYLKSTNARLVIILLIAAFIPITVMGAQQIQTIMQNAAPETTTPCDGSQLLNANPRPAKHGEEIIFSHTDGPITEEMFQEEDFLGNGVFPDNDKEGRKCTYDATNGWIRCKAKGDPNGKKKDAEGNKISDHTWKFRNVKCSYQTVYPKDAPGKPKPPKATSTPKPTSTNGACDRDIKAECTANNKPRLRLKWAMERQGASCNVYLQEGSLVKIPISKECDRNTSIFPGDFEGTTEVQNNKTYKLIVDNGASCKEQSSEATTNCQAGTTPKPTTGNGTPTPTSGNGTPAPSGTTPGPSADQRTDPEVVGLEQVTRAGRTVYTVTWKDYYYPDKASAQYQVFFNDTATPGTQDCKTALKERHDYPEKSICEVDYDIAALRDIPEKSPCKLYIQSTLGSTKDKKSNIVTKDFTCGNPDDSIKNLATPKPKDPSCTVSNGVVDITFSLEDSANDINKVQSYSFKITGPDGELSPFDTGKNKSYLFRGAVKNKTYSFKVAALSSTYGMSSDYSVSKQIKADGCRQLNEQIPAAQGAGTFCDPTGRRGPFCN